MKRPDLKTQQLLYVAYNKTKQNKKNNIP